MHHGLLKGNIVTSEMDWDDIRYLLALVRQGSVRAAAIELEVNHTTVTRRIKRMEKRLGSRMVQKTPGGYQLTSSGEAVLAAGERIETDLASVLKQVECADNKITGTVRVTLTDILLKLARSVVTELLDAYPDLDLELTSTPSMTDIMRLDSDIALRLVALPPEDLVGRRIARIPTAVYAAACSGLTASNANLETARWVRWRAPWNQNRLDIWVQENYPNSKTGASVDSNFALENMVAAGAGIGVLAPWSADKRDDVVRLTPDIDELTLDLWLLTHPDLRGVRRVKVVADALTEFFSNMKSK
jgi:molybdate transport repressor ModE-like protein